jgi:hypothetical protein
VTKSIFNLGRSILFLIVICTILISCDKNDFITSPDASLRSSVDTLKFDTVFTTTGSITKSFKIVNRNSQAIRIAQLSLSGGASSPFKININGVSTVSSEQIDIKANDSIYVFVKVNINPTAANQPFVLTDSIRIAYNGNIKFVQLQAYGQNAVYLNNRHFTSDTTLTGEKPFVILRGLTVDTGVIVTVQAGSKFYCHADAPILINGTLKLNGSASAKIIFQGDRLDEPYSSYPASWPGIYLNASSKDNYFNHVVIKNAFQGLVLQQPASNANPKLIAQRVEISNAFEVGVLLANSWATFQNCLIARNGVNLAIIAGGNYNFENCTIAGYSTLYKPHLEAGTSIANFGTMAGNVVNNNCQVDFTNCIFWGENGSVKNELVTNRQGNATLNVLLRNCIYKAEAQPNNVIFTASIANQSPLFDSINISRNIFDFHISNPAAPGINRGFQVGIGTDLDGKNRSVGITDIGCYELQ